MINLDKEIAGREIWIFGSRMGQYFDDNSKYMFQYIYNHEPAVFPVWITKNRSVNNALKEKGYPVYMAGTEESKYLHENARIAFLSVIQNDVEKVHIGTHTKVFQLWHGTPMKKNDLGALKERYDHVAIASDLFLEKESLGCKNTFKFELTGYPRNDFLLDDNKPEFVEPAILTKLLTNKVISFFPTYREQLDPNKKGDQRGKVYDVWSGLDFDKFEKYLKQHNAVFLVKMHVLQSPADCPIQLQMEKSDHFIVINGNDPLADVYQYLKYTDVMITDYSSILFDFLLLDRPVIFSCFDLHDIDFNRNFRFNYDDITPGRKCMDWKDVFEELKNIFDDGVDSFAEERNSVNKMFNFYRDAKSAARIFQLLSGNP